MPAKKQPRNPQEKEGAAQEVKARAFPSQVIPLASLKPHPRNYRKHPPDQINHLVQSIREHGFYRNIILARDHTILAGHGAVEAAKQAGLDAVSAIILDIDPDSPKALKVLTGENEISHLCDLDDRALSELLREIKDFDDLGLIGTGFDEMMLANLAFTTRPASEIKDQDEAAEWAGLPEYESERKVPRLIVSFETTEARAALLKIMGNPRIHGKLGETMTTWYPDKPKDDSRNAAWEADENLESVQDENLEPDQHEN